MAQRSTEGNQMSKKKCSKCSKKCSEQSPESQQPLQRLASKFMEVIRNIDKMANPPAPPSETKGKKK